MFSEQFRKLTNRVVLPLRERSEKVEVDGFVMEKVEPEELVKRVREFDLEKEGPISLTKKIVKGNEIKEDVMKRPVREAVGVFGHVAGGRLSVYYEVEEGKLYQLDLTGVGKMWFGRKEREGILEMAIMNPSNVDRRVKYLREFTARKKS